MVLVSGLRLWNPLQSIALHFALRRTSKYKDDLLHQNFISLDRLLLVDVLRAYIPEVIGLMGNYREPEFPSLL